MPVDVFFLPIFAILFKKGLKKEYSVKKSKFFAKIKI